MRWIMDEFGAHQWTQLWDKLLAEACGNSLTSPDSHGNLYITVYKNSCIWVFSNGGDFLHSSIWDGNVVKKFSGPDGVRVCVW